MSVGLACVLVVLAENDGGCTVDREGDRFGVDGKVPGYVVGGVTPSLVVPVPKNEAGRIARVEQVAAWLDKNSHDAYGSWLDTETGLVHIDAVDVVTDLNAAIALGRERGEIAIWDGVNAVEVRIHDVTCERCGFVEPFTDRSSDRFCNDCLDK
jgi:hypothetical protein